MVSKKGRFAVFALKIAVALLAGGGAAEYWTAQHATQARRQILAAYIQERDSAEAKATELSNKKSFNAVRESRADRNGDGLYDRWAAAMRPDSPAEATVVYDDESKQGAPDRLSFGTKDGKASYRLKNSPANDSPNLQTFHMSDLKRPENKRQCTYLDLDLDGKVDVLDVFDGSATKRYLLIHDVLTPIAPKDKGDGSDGYWIEDSAGRSIHVKFDYAQGAWAESPQRE